jgi:UDP-N-acetylglucosamine 2-epimerase (non-hydrolysing)
MTKVLVVLGTRPDAIKLSPVVLALRKLAPAIETKVVLTAQHRDLVDPILRFFGILPDYDLNIMEVAQSPLDVMVRLLPGLDAICAAERPDWVVVQGDTTTALAAAQAAFYRQLPVAHVEAGLRTPERYDPFPEEMNRRLISQLATAHFAATESNRQNLLREGLDPATIHVTGNPVIDALHEIGERGGMENNEHPSRDGERTILLTTHRRENFGEPQRNIFEAVNHLVESHPDVRVVFPVHPNPAVVEAARRHLLAHPRILLVEPLDYIPFVQLMARSYLIMTDSGGLQEEAPALGRPVLVLRATTERAEAIRSGNAILTGVGKEAIIDAASRLLDDPELYRKMSQPAYPFGAGGASAKIAAFFAAVELH